jgi:predicted TPR repeat methyltransferase
MSSGNLLADRRLALARALKGAGDGPAALSLLEQALELAPDWAAAWFLMGEWQADAGQRDAAVAAYARSLALDPRDRMGAILRLALLGAAPQPTFLPPAYVAGVFDEYAPRFDTALLQALEYQVPELMWRALAALLPEDASLGVVLDLGCGTGLAGERFRARAAWLEGVDLSAGMLREAGRRAIYDRLTPAEIGAYLAVPNRPYDLILAADVLNYLGDLAPVTALAAQALVPGGRFAFSVERADLDGYRLTASQRYAHGEAYISAVVAAAGLRLEVLRQIVCRKEAGVPVPGLLLVARRPEDADQQRPADAIGAPQLFNDEPLH